MNNNTTNQTNNLNNNVKVSDAANAYKNMANYNYEFIITQNRNTPKVKLVLDFKPDNFYHLSGLHDLNIKSLQSLPRTDVFNGITGGIYKDSLFQNNKDFNTIVDRIECLIRLEEMLDSNDTVFKFNSHMKGTKVKCNYIIKNTKDNRNYFYMISEGKDGKFFGRSCFNRDAIKQKDFSAGHAFYHTLYKAKLTVDEHGQEVDRNELFVADSFRKELEEMKEAGEIKRLTSALSSASSVLTNNSNNNSNNTQNFAIESPCRQQYNTLHLF